MSIRYHEADVAASTRAVGDGVHRLIEYGLEWLIGALPVDAVVFFTVGPDGVAFAPPLAIISDAELDPRTLASTYQARAAALDPFAPSAHAAAASPLIAPGDVDAEAFAAYVAVFLAPFGFAGQTTLFLRDAGRIAAGIALLRAADTPELDEEQLDLLAHTQPVIENAYTLARTAAAAASADAAVGIAGRLSLTDQDVADALVSGAGDAEIALALGIGVPTVRAHVTALMDKLGAHSRDELIAQLRDV